MDAEKRPHMFGVRVSSRVARLIQAAAAERRVTVSRLIAEGAEEYARRVLLTEVARNPTSTLQERSQ